MSPASYPIHPANASAISSNAAIRRELEGEQ
jgi:hypothetical protein